MVPVGVQNNYDHIHHNEENIGGGEKQADIKLRTGHVTGDRPRNGNQAHGRQQTGQN